MLSLSKHEDRSARFRKQVLVILRRGVISVNTGPDQ
jgi:hypothetical protein